jgi:hypothetical protein
MVSSRVLTFLLFLALAVLFGCVESEPPPTTANQTTPNCFDSDGDGQNGMTPTCAAGTDCDDRDSSIYKGAVEVCGDNRDNDCVGGDQVCVRNCTDQDGDRYGEGECLGRDCDDSDANINPGKAEICGNGKDDDCAGGDAMCPVNCTDNDGDGYGVMGSTDCAKMEVDCDDTTNTINPGATEVCNMKDDNCDNNEDECELQGQACSSEGRCQGGLGAHCVNQDDCAGSMLSCDSRTDPKVCRASEGGDCQREDECLTGLACSDGKCSGDFCAVTECTGDYVHCNETSSACVECPYWDVSSADDACSAPESCAPGGWCAGNWMIEDSTPVGDSTKDVFQVSQALAACWIDVRSVGVKDVCYAFWIGNDVSSAITESSVETSYVEGELDSVLTMEENDALYDIWGEGLFNLKEIDWKVDMAPGTAKEVCLWYEPAFAVGLGESLVVDECVNFLP